VSAEVAYDAGPAQLFARVRQSDYELTSFRENPSSEGPAVMLGLRFAIRR
jgi:hypothetical protein